METNQMAISTIIYWGPTMFHALLWCFGYISEQNQPNDLLLFTLKSNVMINK